MITEAAMPIGWKQTKLGDIGKVSMCKRIFKHETLSKGSVPFFKIGTFGKTADSFISNEIFEEYKKKYPYPKKGEILISASGTIGRIVVFNGEESYFQDSNIVWISNPQNKVLNDFLKYVYLKTKWKSTDGGIISRLYNEDLRSIKISLPPLPEQEKIVKVLEAWDSYLEKLTHSIRLKKKIKKGLMEKLLTGKVFLNVDSTQNKKTRYFRIPKHWQILSIGEVANEVSKKNTSNINLPVLSCTKHAGLVDSLKFFKKQIFSKKLNTYKVVDMGQFAYATNHIEEGSIGLQNLYDSGLVSPMYTVFKTNKQKILNDYLFPLLKTVLFRHIFKAKTSSSVNRRGSLRWKSFSKIEIPLPPMEDQEKIANILTTADQEIEALEKKKSLIEQQKKFLLNNLITGRIRLSEFAKPPKH